MNHPVTDDLEVLAAVLDELADGTLARPDAADWARNVRDQFGAITTQGVRFEGSEKEYVWGWLVAADAEAHESLDGVGPRYFYRKADFTEWAARCRKEPSRQRDGSLFAIRPHELDNSGELPGADLYGVVDHLSVFLGQAVRGCDDTDYFEEYLLGSAWGDRYVLIRRLRSTHPDWFHLLLYPDNRTPRESMDRILEALRIDADRVVWRNPKVFGREDGGG